MQRKIIPFSIKLVMSVSLMALLVGALLVASAVYLPVGTAYAQADAGTLVLADFEAGIPAGFVPFADSWDGSGSSTTLTLDLVAVDLPIIPEMSPNSAAAVTFDIAASGSWGGGPGYGGITHDFAPAQDWSDYQGFSLWYYGSNSGANIRVELKSDGGDAFNSNRYEYTFADDFTGWMYFNIPWADFVQRTDFNPGPSPTDPINLVAMWGYSILLPGGANGSFYLDQVAVSGVAAGDDPEPEPESPSGFVDVIDDFESGLPYGADGDGLDIGFVTWGDDWNGTTVALADPVVGDADPLATPGQVGDNHLLQVDLNVIGWGGLTHAFENEAVDTWVPQDWSTYEGVSFWLYGSNTGNGLFFEINENRNPGSTTNDVEIWTYPFVDDFSGWQQFIIPFDAFTRKEIGNGAPNDGLTLEEVHGWAFGSVGSGGPQIYYLDDVGLIVRTTLVDDFETGLPYGTDGDGLDIGFVTWGDDWNGTTVALSDPLVGDTDPLATPGQVGDNHLLQVDLNVIGWGGLTHAFENEAVDTWTPQDWSTYEGVSFWLYGSNTGNGLFFEINENRNPGSTTNDVEIWTYPFTDDFSGWQQFVIPFDAFTRKEIGNGAPNDGLTLEEVHGWAFGSQGSGGPQTYYLDDAIIYGNTGAEIPLVVAFERTTFDVSEGNLADITVRLSRPLGEDDPAQVSVDYATEPGTAVINRDYTPVNGTLTFSQGGSTEQSFTVLTFDNLKHDGDKTVILRLSNLVDIAPSFTTQSVLTILDDDPLDPTLLDDFERGAYLWYSDHVALNTPEIAANDPLALPGQGDYEHILQVDTAVLVDIVINGSVCNSGNGVIPVALLTTDNFDALTVDHNTVLFGDAAETHRDKKTGEAKRHEKDFEGDGDIDLIFHFRFNETGYDCDSMQFTLTGETFDGQTIVCWWGRQLWP